MAERQSKGPLFVVSNRPEEINDVLRRVQNHLDEIQGLRGRAEIFDRVAVGSPEQNADAVRFDTTLTTDGAQTITGEKTIQGSPFRFRDSDGHTIHAFGAKD